MSQQITHSVILIIAIALTFFFPKTSLADYYLQIAAGLFIFLYFAKKIKLVGSNHDRTILLESVIFTLITVSIVNTTGSTESPFFFLIYFLLFSLGLLLEPTISITITCTLIIFFLITLPINTSLKNLLPIFSLAFLTPFAMFMGQEYLELKQSKVKIQKLQEETFLFLSLMLENHLKNIKITAENFMGDHDLDNIIKSVNKMEKLIKKFEKSD